MPLKAAVANLLSVGAAYGVVTFVFQEGHGATLIGLDGPVPIASYVPLLMFAILFGLSMDYEVFLLTQIQEHYKEDGDPHKAVVDGLANTGRVITSAALIMVCVFSSFVLNGERHRQAVRRRAWRWRSRSTRRSCAASPCPPSWP